MLTLLTSLNVCECNIELLQILFFCALEDFALFCNHKHISLPDGIWGCDLMHVTIIIIDQLSLNGVIRVILGYITGSCRAG